MITTSTGNQKADSALRRSEVGVFDKLSAQGTCIAVVGLDGNGLPAALELAGQHNVVGFDICDIRVGMMNDRIDPYGVIAEEKFENNPIEFTSNIDHIKDANLYFISAPVTIGENGKSDLKCLKNATTTVAKCLSQGDFVVFESSAYPGCIEEVCLPLLESISGLKVNTGFKLGYSPEPSYYENSELTERETRFLAAADESSLEQLSQIFGPAMRQKLYKAPSIKVAEAARVIKGVQRDVNVAIMNELSLIFGKLGISVGEALAAAMTAGSLPGFRPGLLATNRHSGIDLFHLIERARIVGVEPDVLRQAQKRNREMYQHVIEGLVRKLKARRKSEVGARILIHGIDLEAETTSLKGSSLIEMIVELENRGMKVDLTDPSADQVKVSEELGIELAPSCEGKYDIALVLGKDLDKVYLNRHFYHKISGDDPIVIDIHGRAGGKVNSWDYCRIDFQV